MRVGALVIHASVFAGLAIAQPLGPAIENPDKEFLVWGDYKIEVNQYGDLGRNWPTPDLVWDQYQILKRQAEANPEPPNTLRTVLLVLPHLVATAVREDEDGTQTIIGTRHSEMDASDVKWVIDQWRQFEEMVYVYSGGNAWVRTDIKVIDEPVAVTTDEDWGFWAGQQRELLDRYIPFNRGDYQSYNSIYSSIGLNAGPHGGTVGGVGGIKGCGTSDTAYYGRDGWKPNRTGYVVLHEWLNQQCSATSNMMPYPEDESLWNNYVLHKIGYREDVELDDWPWLSLRRDTMTQIIRPGMWRRWTAIDPYRSAPIGQWSVFGPFEAGLARELSTAPESLGVRLAEPMQAHSHFDLVSALENAGAAALAPGVFYLRTFVESDGQQEVRLWAAADESFELWLNGVRIRQGTGWNYSEDDGQLFEKVAYVTLPKGISTLLLVLPNTDDRAEFRVRFCDLDGSGRQPRGVSTFTERGGQTILPLGEPMVHDFAHPRFYAWADINDMPWTKLPRIGEEELGKLTGIDSLRIVTTAPARVSADGEEYEPCQHIFLDVPGGSVSSARLDVPHEDQASLDNDLDFNWESMAWLRVPNLPGPEKDVLLLRFDVAEPLMHLLRTTGRPANESIVGWMLIEHKLVYVVLVDLSIDDGWNSGGALNLLSMAPVFEQ